MTALHLAVANGHSATVQLILADARANVNSLDRHQGRSPLHIAAAEGHSAIMHVLSTHPQINMKNVVKSVRSIAMHALVTH